MRTPGNKRQQIYLVGDVLIAFPRFTGDEWLFNGLTVLVYLFLQIG